MQRYFFDYRDGTGCVTRDEFGQEAGDVNDARAMALAAAGDAAIDLTRGGREARLTIEVRDGDEVVATAKLIIELV